MIIKSKLSAEGHEPFQESDFVFAEPSFVTTELSGKNVSCFLDAVNSRPIQYGPDFPFEVPVQLALPGGRAVNYLAHETEAFGDDLSSRITEQSRDVASLGDEIQHAADVQSQVVEDIGREVDSDESIPFPASQAEEDVPDEEEEEEHGGNEWPSEER